MCWWHYPTAAIGKQKQMQTLAKLAYADNCSHVGLLSRSGKRPGYGLFNTVQPPQTGLYEQKKIRASDGGGGGVIILAVSSIQVQLPATAPTSLLVLMLLPVGSWSGVREVPGWRRARAPAQMKDWGRGSWLCSCSRSVLEPVQDWRSGMCVCVCVLYLWIHAGCHKFRPQVGL